MNIKFKYSSNWRLIFGLVLTLFLLIAFVLRNPSVMTHNKIRLKVPCLNLPFRENSEITIEKVLEYKNTFIDLSRQECAIIHPLIDQIFETVISSRPIVVKNKGFETKVKDWFKNNKTLIRIFMQQRITSIYNKWTRTTTVRNPLRGDRPQPPVDSDQDLFNEIKESGKPEKCDFCAQRVAMDPIGTIEDKNVYVAANAFKLQDYHALFIPKKHNPLDLKLEDFVSLFRVANEWFDKAIADSYFGHDHPAMIWDSLPHAGNLYYSTSYYLHYAQETFIM